MPSAIPLLNVSGIHEPWALRSIIEVVTEDGRYGLPESYGDEQTLSQLQKVASRLEGVDVFHLNELKAIIKQSVDGEPQQGGIKLAPGTNQATTLPRILAASEVAFLDLMGKITGRSVCDLLGGKVRDAAPYSAYLFYKYGRHQFSQDGWVDDWGEVLTPETTKRLVTQMKGLLQHLEDPAPGKDSMAEVHRSATIPLATNMCVIGFFDLPEAITKQSEEVILSDHHYWGGLQATRALARIGETWGLGLSMHSNSHLGNSP